MARYPVYGIVAGLVLGSSPAEAGNLDQVIKLLAQQNSAGSKAQDGVSELDAEQRELEQEYEAVTRQADSLRLYVDQLEATVQGQRDQIASLEAQIDRVVDVGRRTIPLMQQMVATLEEFVEVDVPFLLDERRTRVERLKKVLAAPDVTDAEKYRLILEAYQIEMEYGRTIEAYRGRLAGDGEEDGQVVEFLRFGRAVFAYASLDGESFGVWDQDARAWVELDPSFGHGIRRGLRIARKQAPPDLVFLPIEAPEGAAR